MDPVADGRIANLVAGGFAGFMNTLLFYPLDVVKTRMQVEGQKNLTLMASLRRGGMFRGLSASMLALVPNWALYWITYEELKRLGGPPSAMVHLGAAVGAGTITAVVTSPLWVIKTRMQVEVPTGGRQEYVTVMQSLSKVICEEGFLALYKGLFPSLLGLLHVAVQFPLYENIRKRITDSELNQAHSVVIASSTSKVAASFAAYPHEVIRSRLQNNRTHMQQGYNEIRYTVVVIRELIGTEGIFALYRGLGPNLLKTVPSTVVTFTTYELAKQYLVNMKQTAG